MLRLAEKRTRRFRNITRNFACLLLVSHMSQECVSLVIQILTCKWIRMHGCYHFIVIKALPQKCFASIAWLTMFWCSLNETKANIRIDNVYQPILVKCAQITIFDVSPRLRCPKTHWKVIFIVLIRWFDDILYLPYFKIGEYIVVFLNENCM